MAEELSPATRTRPRVCMIAYANYYTDARIKNYVRCWQKQGCEIDIFALGEAVDVGPGTRLFVQASKHWGGNPIAYALAQLWFALRVFLLVGARHFRRPYSLVHVHNIPNFLTLTAVIPRMGGAKVVLDIHDTMPEAYATKFDLDLNRRLIKLLALEERISAKGSDLVITTNELQREVVTAHGVPASKIHIIMNTGNEEIFKPSGARPEGRPFTFVYHGTMAERLGLDLIVRGFHVVALKHPDTRLLLIGGGDFVDDVEALVGRLGLTHRVEMSPFVPVEYLPSLLREADVGVVGNRAYTEAKKSYMLPVKMLEYAAMEIPTVAPRLHTIVSYFDDTNAILYEPDDVRSMSEKMLWSVEHPTQLAHFKEGLRAFNERFNWNAMEERYLNLMHDLLEK